MGVNFASTDADPRTEADCFDLLLGRKTAWEFDHGREGATALCTGTAEGKLVGGNLAVLNALIGTPWQLDATDAVLVLEECDELLFRLDRFLFQAAESGLFCKVKAVLFGTIENMVDGEQHDGSGNPFGQTLQDMLRHYVPQNVPLVYGLPLGHGSYMAAHPIGAQVRVEIGTGQTVMRLL
jgi:muramoyltetrapeptide carboxypeptidase